MSDPHINSSDPRFTSWVKSTRSGPNESCVYVSPAGDSSDDIGVADDKAGPESAIQVFSHESWTCFIAAVKAGEFHI